MEDDSLIFTECVKKHLSSHPTPDLSVFINENSSFLASNTKIYSDHQGLSAALTKRFQDAIIWVSEPGTYLEISKTVKPEEWETLLEKIRAVNKIVRKGTKLLGDAVDAAEPDIREALKYRLSQRTTRKRRADDSTGNSSGSRKAQNTSTTKNHADVSKEEFDGITFNGMEATVGTLIKRQALSIHKKFLKNPKLPVSERKLMSNGLSSILDLIDEREDGQKGIIKEHWASLKDHFKDLKIDTDQRKLKWIVDTWTIVTKTCQAAGSVRLGEEYLCKLRLKESTQDTRMVYKALEHMLELLENSGDMLAQRSTFTEYDYLRVLWSPLLSRIFASPLRIISGESIFKYTTGKKQIMYEESSSVRGFKIDIRFVLDKDGETYDVGACELGKDGADSKIISDEGKLVREGKDVVDCLLDTLHPVTHNKVIGWVVHIDASEIALATVQLAANGLYVAYPQFEGKLPTTISEMQDFSAILCALLTMKEHMMQVYHVLPTKDQKSNVISTCFNRVHANNEPETIESWQRDTWYTPTSTNRSKVPANLFGRRSTFDLTRRLISAQNEDIYGDDADEFGWVKKNDKFYNVHTGTTVDKHPLHD